MKARRSNAAWNRGTAPHRAGPPRTRPCQGTAHKASSANHLPSAGACGFHHAGPLVPVPFRQAQFHEAKRRYMKRSPSLGVSRRKAHRGQLRASRTELHGTARTETRRPLPSPGKATAPGIHLPRLPRTPASPQGYPGLSFLGVDLWSGWPPAGRLRALTGPGPPAEKILRSWGAGCRASRGTPGIPSRWAGNTRPGYGLREPASTIPPRAVADPPILYRAPLMGDSARRTSRASP